MSLSQRERWIHMYTVISIIGRVNGEPDNFIRNAMEAMRHERCRKLSNKQIGKIIDEMEEDRLACMTAMDYIVDEMESNITGGAAV